MTEGRGRVSVPPTTGGSPSAITVALPARTSTRARRNETTASGSYPAFSTSVRTGSHPLSFGTLTWLVASRCAAGGVPDDSCRRRRTTRSRTGTGHRARTTEGAASRGKRRLHGRAQRYVAEPHRHVRPPDFVPRRARALLTGASNRRWKQSKEESCRCTTFAAAIRVNIAGLRRGTCPGTHAGPGPRGVEDRGRAIGNGRRSG